MFIEKYSMLLPSLHLSFFTGSLKGFGGVKGGIYHGSLIKNARETVPTWSRCHWGGSWGCALTTIYRLFKTSSLCCFLTKVDNGREGLWHQETWTAGCKSYFGRVAVSLRGRTAAHRDVNRPPKFGVYLASEEVASLLDYILLKVQFHNYISPR